MVIKKGWRIVIDASVARAAGETIVPVSRHCRLCLERVRQNGHFIVMTEPLYKEWRKHQSRFAKAWFTSMTARKKVIRLNDEYLPELHLAIATADVSEKDRAAMLKDIHLLEAAVASNHNVLSLDKVVHRLFAQLCVHCGVIKQIIWLNPDEQFEQVIQWLNFDFKYNQQFCLINTLVDDV